MRSFVKNAWVKLGFDSFHMLEVSSLVAAIMA